MDPAASLRRCLAQSGPLIGWHADDADDADDEMEPARSVPQRLTQRRSAAHLAQSSSARSLPRAGSSAAPSRRPKTRRKRAPLQLLLSMLDIEAHDK